MQSRMFFLASGLMMGLLATLLGGCRADEQPPAPKEAAPQTHASTPSAAEERPVAKPARSAESVEEKSAQRTKTLSPPRPGADKAPTAQPTRSASAKTVPGSVTTPPATGRAPDRQQAHQRPRAFAINVDVPKTRSRGRKARSVDKIDKIEQMVIDRWKKVETLSCKMTIWADVKKGMRQLRKGTGTYDYMTKDGKVYLRMRLLNSLMVERAKDDAVLTGQKVLKIFDGDYYYHMEEMHAGTVATKSRARRRDFQFLGGPELINQIHQYEDVRLVAERAKSGQDMYVFRTARNGGKSRAIYYVHADSGLLAKLVTENDVRGVSTRTTFSEYKINQPLPDDRFVFKLPEGVTLKDLTQSASADAPAPPTP